MPNWSTTPPVDPRGHALSLIRTPANGRFVLFVTSPDLIGCATHWFGGRTVPCESPECEACNEGVPWRWHSYLSGLVAGTRRHVMMEFTAQATEILCAYRKAHGTLRGCQVHATRHRNRHNGRVLLNCTPGPLQQMNLPNAPNLVDVLSIIWNVPRPALEETGSERKMPRVGLVLDRMNPGPKLNANTEPVTPPR